MGAAKSLLIREVRDELVQRLVPGHRRGDVARPAAGGHCPRFRAKPVRIILAEWVNADLQLRVLLVHSLAGQVCDVGVMKAHSAISPRSAPEGVPHRTVCALTSARPGGYVSQDVSVGVRHGAINDAPITNTEDCADHALLLPRLCQVRQLRQELG